MMPGKQKKLPVADTGDEELRPWRAPLISNDKVQHRVFLISNDKVQHRVFLISHDKVQQEAFPVSHVEVARNELGLRPRLIKSSIKYYELIRMINRVYHSLSINYDCLIFRNLGFLGVPIENMDETQLGLRPRHESQCIELRTMIEIRCYDGTRANLIRPFPQ